MKQNSRTIIVIAAATLVLFVQNILVASAQRNNQSPIERLPVVGGTRLGRIGYIRSETRRDPAIEAALRRVYEFNNTSNDRDRLPRYLYNRVDLNGDRRPEILLYLYGQTVCGTGGCNLFIFQEMGRENYRLVTQMSLARNPVVVTHNRTRGWNDLVMFVSGGGMRGQYVTLRFNGQTYPENATDAPRVRANSLLAGTAYLADEISLDRGIILESNE
jgi:hypothetical protein